MSRVNLVVLVLRDPLVLLVKRAREAQLESRDLLDPWECVDLEEPLVLVVCLVWLADRDQWACLVPVVLLVHLEPVDLLEMLVVLVRLVLLGPEVSLVALAVLDPLERKGLLVPLVKMVAPAPLAQLDPEASLVISDSPVLRDLLASLASLVRRDLLVQLD